MHNSSSPLPENPKRTILLTGFDAFGGQAINPSWLVAHALHGQRIAGHTVVAAQLPTVFGQALQQLQALLTMHRPAIILCLGQAGGRFAVSLERVAINVNDARIPDNQGVQPVDTPVVGGGPAAYFATLPLKAMLRAVQQMDVRCEISQTAGTFVCNHVFYGLLHMLSADADSAGARGGFAHVPWLPEQGVPHMALSDMVRAIHTALWTAILVEQDIVLGAGTTH